MNLKESYQIRHGVSKTFARLMIRNKVETPEEYRAIVRKRRLAAAKIRRMKHSDALAGRKPKKSKMAKQKQAIVVSK